MSVEKQVSYTNTNTYSTLNNWTDTTRNVWLVFHGMGYLSKFFLRYFKGLDPGENYIIAPQAPSKYYMGDEYKHVGANWLTRVNTMEDSKAVLLYVDAVYTAEFRTMPRNFIVMGYSQGVSIATRWLSSRKKTCRHLILHSGGIPNELDTGDFDHFSETTVVDYIYGNRDPYINDSRIIEERAKAEKLFSCELRVTPFDGAHVVNSVFLQQIAVNTK